MQCGLTALRETRDKLLYLFSFFVSLQPQDSPHLPPPQPSRPANLCSPRRPSRPGPAPNAWRRAPDPARSPRLQTQDSASAFPLLNPRSLPRALCHLTLPHIKWVTRGKKISFQEKMKINVIWLPWDNSLVAFELWTISSCGYDSVKRLQHSYGVWWSCCLWSRELSHHRYKTSSKVISPVPASGESALSSQVMTELF